MQTVILISDTDVQLMNSDGTIWQSERISWDGIKDLKFQDNVLTGLSYDPTNSNGDWVPFSIDFATMQVTGGSYRNYLTGMG